MSIKTAVILAAGRGIRLQAMGRIMPKGFIELGVQPIVQESVDKLLSVGIERIVIVTGHLSEFYERLQAYYPSIIITIYNPHFADTGSLYSLYQVRDVVRDDFLLLESDIVYEARALQVVSAAPHANVLLVSGWTQAGDEVYVASDQGRLLGLSKDSQQLSVAPLGELVGITKVSASLFRALLAYCDRQFKHDVSLSYEMDGLSTVAQAESIFCVLLDGLIWCEIDDVVQLKRARQHIYPQLTAQQPQRCISAFG